MSYVDEEKRSFSIGYIIRELNTLDTLAKYNNFVDTISKSILEKIVKEGFKSEKSKTDLKISNLEQKKINDSEMEV